MNAAEFFRRYAVEANCAHIGDYRYGDNERRMWMWSFFLRGDGAAGRRVLTGMHDISVQYALHWDIVLSQLAQDTLYGQLSFEDYLAESLGEIHDPLKQYQGWISVVEARHRVDAWLGDDDQMRADFYNIAQEEQ